MMPYFQLPSLSFLRRKQNDVDLETLFIRSERKKNAVPAREHFAESPAAENTDFEAEDAETFQPQTEEYPPAAYPAGYGPPESEFRTPERHRILRTAAGEELSFYGTGAEHTEEKFPTEIPSHSPQENAMPEKKSDAQLSAAIGALTECARGQLRYLKKNYDLLKTQTEERYFN